jgi:hypothetical protein
MRLLPALVLVAGCNQIYGIDDTTGSSCQSTPSFVTQAMAVVTGCTDYVPSVGADLAVALCSAAISESSVDAPAMTMSSVSPPANLISPRLTSDGDQLFARSALANAFVAYTRTNGTWTDPVTQAVGAVGVNDTISAPSATTVRHLVHAGGEFDELAEAGAGTWSLVHSYAATDLGVDVASAPQLSADGRRLVFVGKSLADSVPSIYYAARDSIDDTFGIAIRINSTENKSDPFLSDDCNRLYFDEATVVSYLQR